MAGEKFKQGDKVVVKNGNHYVNGTVHTYNRIYRTYTVFIDGTRKAANYPENEIQERDSK